MTDPNRHPTQFDWDLSGRLVQETVATGNQVKYSYNARNLLAQITNARGQPRQLEYDAAGRLTHFTDIDGTVSFTYDNNGNVLTVSDSQGTITRTYDALNRIASYTDVNGNTLHYEYDEVRNLVTLAYPDGKLVHYEYDAADQLVKVTDWAGRITQYQYDANGRLIKTHRPNGTVQTRQYDVKGQLLAQTDLSAQENILVAYTFSYDAAGNLVQEQVTPEWLPVLPTSVKMTYTAANRLATYNGQAVQFDADGNLLTAPLNGQMSPLQFDSRNRLVQAGNTNYRYDAENQRIGVNQTNYVINSQPALSQVLVKEENGVKTFYVYGLGLLGEEKDGEYRSYHFDFRGSTVALTDARGQVTQRFQYGPYGELLKGEAAVTPFLFNGKFGVMTESNRLYYMRARFYSPEMKRFVNMDVLLGKVVEGQTLNRYSYVKGNPLSSIDPFGLATIDIPLPSAPSWLPEWAETIIRMVGTRTLAIIGLILSVPGDTVINQKCQLFYRGDVIGKIELWAPLVEEVGIEAAKNLLLTANFKELAFEHACGSIGSPFISITTNKRTAELYAKSTNGVVYEIWLLPGMAIFNKENANTVWDSSTNEAVPDDEWLVPIHIGPEFVNSKQGCDGK